MKNPWIALLIDAVLVIVFAAIGVASHYGVVTLPRLALVAWPFLVGLLLAHIALRTWKGNAARIAPQGVLIALITVVAAMAIRTLLGAGTATAFVVVSFVVNTVLLLGWRAIAALASRRKAGTGRENRR